MNEHPSLLGVRADELMVLLEMLDEHGVLNQGRPFLERIQELLDREYGRGTMGEKPLFHDLAARIKKLKTWRRSNPEDRRLRG